MTVLLSLTLSPEEQPRHSPEQQFALKAFITDLEAEGAMVNPVYDLEQGPEQAGSLTGDVKLHPSSLARVVPLVASWIRQRHGRRASLSTKGKRLDLEGKSAADVRRFLE